MLMPAKNTMTQSDVDEGTPVSVKIRERIVAARKRFHANDNIADFIEPGELDRLLDEVQSKMQGVLTSLVIDTDNDHNTGQTARRVAKMYLTEVFKGRYIKGPTVTEFPNAEHLNELMIVGPITVRSACSHHLCPVIGVIWIGVLPNEHTNVIGLSKYARLAEWVMGRPQIQEEAVVQLADLIQQKNTAGWPGHRHGGQPFLHGLARRQGCRQQDDQFGDAWQFSQRRQPASGIFVFNSQKELSHVSTPFVCQPSG